MIENPNTQSYVYRALLGQYTSPIELGLFNLHYGEGVPAATLGANGDVYVRKDGAFSANTKLYGKESGSWVAAVTA